MEAMKCEGFRNRVHAGRCLARQLTHLQDEDPIVLALPRGGVVVGFEVASALDAPLDIVTVRKIGAPFHREYGIGALVDGDEPELLLDRDRLEMLGVTDEQLRAVIEHELSEIHRRERLYRAGKPRIDLRDRVIIVVDDGIATGSSIRAALRGLRRMNPRRLVLAVPVAPPDTIESLRNECDEIVCLLLPPGFRAVGEFYEDFEQTNDDEVIALLQESRRLQERSRRLVGSTNLQGG